MSECKPLGQNLRSIGCLTAVAPISATCAAALAEGGANPVADIGCFAGVVATLANPVCAMVLSVRLAANLCDSLLLVPDVSRLLSMRCLGCFGKQYICATLACGLSLVYIVYTSSM